MGGLSMNPDNHGVEGAPKLAAQIAREEEELGLNKSTKPASVQQQEEEGGEKKKDKLKIAGFQLDTTYPRTIPGFVRILQVLTLIVAFICLLLGKWPDQGSYTFYCIFLVFGALISAYLLFTVVAGRRGDKIFGISWRTVELVYFGVFGLLIFIGACLAANKSEGAAALNAGAVFGFFAVATFVYYFWVTWKSTPSSGEEKPADGEEGDVAKATHSQSGGDDYRLEMLDEIPKEEQLQRRQSRDYRGHSLPQSLNDELYENGKVATEGFNQQRRRHSNSEKDSAYSEGTSTPTRGKMMPQKMRRTGSGFNLGGDNFRREDYDHVTDKQPLSHMTHRGRHGGSFRGRSLQPERAVGYPQELNPHSFHNPGFEADDLHRNSGRRKSMPEWLRAALGDDVQQEDMIEDESVQDHPINRVQTLPPGRNHEFPLLNESDEESIQYPSVSQNGLPPGSRLFSQSLPHHKRRRSTGGALKHHHHHHHGGTAGRRRIGSRRHHHHRHHHNRRSQHHHPHHRGPRHQGARGGEMGRRPVTGAHEDYLRRMVENDELVMREERKDGMQGFQPLEGRPIETGKRRVIPEQPISIHFPEQSRWDDDNHENPLMTKYFHDAQQMRA